MRFPLALALIAISLSAAAAAAEGEVWMWKDSAGEVHYSDRPVLGAVRVKTVNPTRSSADSSVARRGEDKSSPAAASASGPGNPAPPASTVQAVQQDVAKKRDEQCKLAKETYDKSVSARRIYKTGKDGEREYMSDADAEAYRVKARSDMDEACGATSKP